MTQKEFEQLKEILGQLKSINNKLDKVLGKTTEEESPVNKMLRKATSKETSDKQYCQTLVELNKLPFGLSAKQLGWCLMYTPRHHQCGESIQSFIRKQFERQQNKNDYVEQVCSVLRTKYTNENNVGFIQKMIERLKEISGN